MGKSRDPNERTLAAPPFVAPVETSKSAFILLLTGVRFGELYKLPQGRVVRIGRSEGADICLDDDGVSRLHCSLEAHGADAILRDLGSHNGTFVGGERVTERKLVDGDRVQIGADLIFKFAYADEMEINYQRRVAEIALRDPLTGLYNRRHFGERLDSEFAGARRYRHPLSLLLIDLDELNKVNEVHGRRGGDEVLRGAAGALQEVARGADVVARVGGDEFAVLLRETDLAGARSMAERMRQSIEQMRTPFEGQEITVTATVGIAVALPDRAREGEEPQDLVDSAERILERLRQLGTNRIGN
jgi:diguanylate cyclase (GGDEF)-like protein